MFFGKGGAEKINAEDLKPLLDVLFSKRLGPLEMRVSSITGELEAVRREFVSVCMEFAALDAEPDTEDMYIANKNAIKTQKGVYARALARMVENIKLDDDSPNPYLRARAVLQNAESMINEILKLNAGYKQVVYCYSNHLRQFKRLFSTMGTKRDALRLEVEKRNRDFSEYSTLSGHVFELGGLMGEAKDIDIAISALSAASASSPGAAAPDESESMIAKQLDERRKSLENANDELSRARNRINLLTAPLDRPARKFDHGSLRKRQLHGMMENPIGSINDESDYEEFVKLVNELKVSIGSGAIEIKNKSETSSQVDTLLDSNIFSLISSLKTLEAKKEAISGEVATTERALYDIREIRASSERAVMEAERLQAKAAEIGRSIASKKESIESLFQGYYGKRISII